MRAGRAARLQRRGGRVVSRGAHQVGRRRDAERGRRGGEGVALERVRRAAGQRRGERAERLAGWVGAAVVVGGSARGGAGGAAAVVWGLGEVRPASSPRRSAASSAFTAALSRLDFSRSSSSCKRAVSASTARLFFLGVVSGLSASLLQGKRPNQLPRGM